MRWFIHVWNFGLSLIWKNYKLSKETLILIDLRLEPTSNIKIKRISFGFHLVVDLCIVNNSCVQLFLQQGSDKLLQLPT